MATVTRYHVVTLPNGETQSVPYQVDEAVDAARAADSDYDKHPDAVVKECVATLDEFVGGRHDTEALRATLRRVLKLLARPGVGTSPSDPTPPVAPSAS